MGDLVNFPTKPIPSDNRIAGALRTGERLDRDEILRARVLKNKKEKRWVLAEDCIQIARNLYDILHLPEIGRTPADILIAARKSQAGDSTKRLNLFSIPPDLLPEEEERRSTHLRKGTQHFVDIAEAAAESAGLPTDHYYLKLFGGTSFMDPPTKDSEPPHCIVLSDTLQKAAGWIASRQDLKRFFDGFKSKPYGYDLLNYGALDHRGYGGDPFDIQDHCHSYCGDGLTLPSLPLFSMPLGPSIAGILHIAENPVMRPLRCDMDPFGEIPALNWQHGVLTVMPSFDGMTVHMPVRMSFQREIWLSFAPAGVDRRPVPCFDMRTRTVVEVTSEEMAKLAFPYWCESPRLYVRNGHNLHAALFVPDAGEAPVNRTCVTTPFEPFFPKSQPSAVDVLKGKRYPLSGAYFYYERINPSSCRKFLDIHPGEGWLSIRALQRDGVPAYCPAGTMASAMELAFLGTGGERLDTVWDQAVAAHIDRHEIFMQEHLDRAEQRLGALRQEWSQAEE
jgi:hypothetical protein